MQRSRRLVDLSHPIRSGMPMYPGLPSPRIEPYLSHAASRSHYGGAAQFTVTRIFMLGSTGTYLDSPWHRHPEAADLSELPLESLADLPGVCLDPAPDHARAVVLAVEPDQLAGRAVLIRTGWGARWPTAEYWRPGPYLDAATAAVLAAARPALVGVDFWNVDDPADLARPAHTRLLEAGIPIVEHLRGLERLPDSGFRFHAVPPAVVGGASFPVRALAVVED
jgi:kynurenine formamidase